jgi:hypothetical protein
MFEPHSSGSIKQRIEIAQHAINRTVPELADLGDSLGHRKLTRLKVETFSRSIDVDYQALGLKFEKYGSDKAWHKYHHFYGSIFTPASVKMVFEIGLGTNNVDVVSNMGVAGRPGASLRAFRDFYPRAELFGADVDRRILFTEERINTFHVDQTDEQSMRSLMQGLPDGFDLIIDDGLHSPLANLPTLRHCLPKIRKGGLVVIEDIQANTIDVWRAVAAMLPLKYSPLLIEGHAGYLFSVQRVD